MDKEPRNFDPTTAAKLTDDTEVYTQVLGGAEVDGDYKYTLADLLVFLKGKGVIVPFSPTPYANDAAAITAGASAGDWYYLTAANDYGIVIGNGGLIKQIQ
jgi:hypothetical protein